MPGGSKATLEGLTVVEDASVGQQQRHQLGVLVQLHGVLALVGKQSANVDGEVHFVGEAREERQHQFVVVAWRREVRRQPVALAKIVCVEGTTRTASWKKGIFFCQIRKKKKHWLGFLIKSGDYSIKTQSRQRHLFTSIPIN